MDLGVTTMATHRPRLLGDLMLGTRKAAAVLTARHENVVRRHCEPIACDLESRALLYDLDQVAAAVRDLPRREKPLAPIR